MGLRSGRGGAGRTRTARSGIWLCRGLQLPHGTPAQALLQPVDQPRELLRRDVRFPRAEPVLAVGQVSATSTCTAAASKPKSASNSLPRRSRRRPISWAMCSASRLGAASPRSSDSTPPSTRNSSSRRRRAPTAARARSSASVVEQAGGGLEHVLLAHDRLEERGLRAIDGRRDDGHQRLGRMPQRLVEAVQQLGWKRAAKGARGWSHQLADAAQARDGAGEAERPRRGGARRAAGLAGPALPRPAATMRPSARHGAPPPRRRPPYRRLPGAGRDRRRASAALKIGQQRAPRRRTDARSR